jgi:ferredoxin-like protein FixX
MLDVNAKTCLKCSKYAVYNLEGNLPLYCFEHKEKDMINIVANKCLECKITQISSVQNKKIQRSLFILFC